MGSQPTKSQDTKRRSNTNSPTPVSLSIPTDVNMPLFRKKSDKNNDAQDDASKPSLFRKQSAEKKKRLQHQLYLARESPEPIFDISKTEINEVPSGIFSLCKVLQKEVLLAHNNWLISLKGGGLMKDLGAIRILDLHNNELQSLPDDLADLQCLQSLNLENNKLKHLPPSIGTIHTLQTLNVRGNKLKELPETVCNLSKLRTLNISKNHVTNLPSGLCKIRVLDTLILDACDMHFPPAGVCGDDTETIMKFLCIESGMEYIAPSQFLLDVLDSPKSGLPNSSSNNSLKAEMIAVSESVMLYEQMKDKRRASRIALEKQLEEDQRLQAEMAAHAASNKQHLIDYMAQDQERIQGELAHLQQQKDAERGQLLDTLYLAEHNAERLVSHLLEISEKARHTEELMEQMEQQRIESEQWFVVRQEEAESLRRREVLAAMEKILEENNLFNDLLTHNLNSRGQLARQAQQTASGRDGRLEDVLSHKQAEQQGLVDQLLREEKLQKEAFEALQLQKDAKHSRITGQIDLIQQELAQLTLLEVEQRELNLDHKMNILEEKRYALSDMLVQLLGERQKREEELKERLLEMEEQKANTATDYWLVQYQRLMDRKPQNLICQESQLEFSVKDVVSRASATDYLPQFIRHRITIETLCQMNDDDFKQVGIHELGLRKALLMEVKRYIQRTEEETAAAAKKLKQPEDDWPQLPTPKIAIKPSVDETMSPSAPPVEVLARGINSECVVCMETQSQVLFLNCGHVCCCKKCGGPLIECPLCRGEIVQRILLGS